DDVGVAHHGLLDLERRDVLGVADDEVLETTGDPDVAVTIDQTEVAGAEPAIGVEGVGIQGGVDVALEALRSPESQLALLADLELPFAIAHHAHLDAGDGSPDGL